jgi:hypothetical protein
MLIFKNMFLFKKNAKTTDLEQFRPTCISVIYIKGNIETLHSCFVGFFFNLLDYLTKTNSHHLLIYSDRIFSPFLYSKHVDRFTILKHTILKVPQNSNIFNDVSKGVRNKIIQSFHLPHITDIHVGRNCF